MLERCTTSDLEDLHVSQSELDCLWMQVVVDAIEITAYSVYGLVTIQAYMGVRCVMTMFEHHTWGSR